MNKMDDIYTNKTGNKWVNRISKIIAMNQLKSKCTSYLGLKHKYGI